MDPWPADESLDPPMRYPAGVRLFGQGDRVRDLFLIDEGFVKLTLLSPGGTDLIVGLRTTGWLLGAGNAVLGRAFQTTAETISPCELRALELTDFNRLRDQPAVSAWTQRMQAREWLDQVALMRLLGGRGPQQRVEALLLTLARASSNGDVDRDFKLNLPLKHYEMAQMVNLSPEHFSRVLRALETQSVILRDRGWIVIPSKSPLFSALKALDES
jgi:CRP/FNR family transcriptional regulator